MLFTVAFWFCSFYEHEWNCDVETVDAALWTQWWLDVVRQRHVYTAYEGVWMEVCDEWPWKVV
eukprot:6213991-Amphidinium_carterae.4